MLLLNFMILKQTRLQSDYFKKHGVQYSVLKINHILKDSTGKDLGIKKQCPLLETIARKKLTKEFDSLDTQREEINIVLNLTPMNFKKFTKKNY